MALISMRDSPLQRSKTVPARPGIQRPQPCAFKPHFPIITTADMSTQGPDHTTPAQDACPVDEKTRLAWMKANPGMSRPGAPSPTPAATGALKANGCDSEEIDQSLPTAPPGLFSRWFSSAPPPAVDASAPAGSSEYGLGTQRVISTIPRASPVDDSAHSKPANSEKESGVSASGNWIYPSEKMFFEAMKRKVWTTMRVPRSAY